MHINNFIQYQTITQDNTIMVAGVLRKVTFQTISAERLNGIAFYENPSFLSKTRSFVNKYL